MKTYIERTRRCEKVSVSTVSVEMEGFGWSNCLYLQFWKNDFPMIESPPLVDCDWFGKKGRRFDYGTSVLNEIDFHGGITFYKETVDVETGFTRVKVGCDFQHLGDEHYQSADYGALILENHADQIVTEFAELVSALSKGKTVTA